MIRDEWRHDDVKRPAKQRCAAPTGDGMVGVVGEVDGLARGVRVLSRYGRNAGPTRRLIDSRCVPRTLGRLAPTLHTGHWRMIAQANELFLTHSPIPTPMTSFVPPEHDARRIPSPAADAAGPPYSVSASSSADANDNEKIPPSAPAAADGASDAKGAAAPNANVGTLHRSLKSRHV